MIFKGFFVYGIIELFLNFVSMKNNPIAIFWFRRDLRLEDNTGLNAALNSGLSVLPIFIFDTNILDELAKNDARVCFIHEHLNKINDQLLEKESCVKVLSGNPEKIWKDIITQYNVKSVYTNKDYEPYAIKRDEKIKQLLEAKGINFNIFKDQVIFEENDILKDNGDPYTIYTPYKNKWLLKFEKINISGSQSIQYDLFYKHKNSFPTLAQIGFEQSEIIVPNFRLEQLHEYSETRDYPAKNTTSKIGPHLRFGTISLRELVLKTKHHEVFLKELIWREFFMQILFHFPHVVDQNFKSKYNGIQWRNNPVEFEAWCKGETGYPIVDAGMRELNKTGFMHNRVRMITAGFLCKHLLIDWRWGEAYFAKKLLDYELSANNGNWQWAAGTGCDAAPYFRIFNPITQLSKFDKGLEYVKKWVPEFEGFGYPEPIVEHNFARKRALETYKKGIL